VEVNTFCIYHNVNIGEVTFMILVLLPGIKSIFLEKLKTMLHNIFVRVLYGRSLSHMVIP
jgi:hypothetical protein